jgi:hypothetical protein
MVAQDFVAFIPRNDAAFTDAPMKDVQENVSEMQQDLLTAAMDSATQDNNPGIAPATRASWNRCVSSARFSTHSHLSFWNTYVEYLKGIVGPDVDPLDRLSTTPTHIANFIFLKCDSKDTKDANGNLFNCQGLSVR